MPSCHSVHDLELAVQDLWAHLPQDNIRCLIHSMPDRVAACIAARGGQDWRRFQRCGVAHGFDILRVLSDFYFPVVFLSAYALHLANRRLEESSQDSSSPARHPGDLFSASLLPGHRQYSDVITGWFLVKDWEETTLCLRRHCFHRVCRLYPVDSGRVANRDEQKFKEAFYQKTHFSLLYYCPMELFYAPEFVLMGCILEEKHYFGSDWYSAHT
ncbi:transposable element Tcb2 transposase [Trichonephila clavipes]|nr:transposable element Tcb2 transposase [Trichonephila clavipes]